MPEKFSEHHFLEDYGIHEKPEAQKAAKKKEHLTGERGINFNKKKRIEAYLERLEHIFLNEDEETRERNIHILKPQIYENTVIQKENFPEEYFDQQRRLAREMGMGEVSFGEKEQEQEIQKVQEAQKASLDSWIEYLTGQECKDYSSDVKFFTMRGVLSLGNYNPDKHSFSKRRPETTSPFASINHLAVSKVMRSLEAKHHSREDIEYSKTVLDLIEKKKSFKDMYEAVLKELDEEVGERDYQITDGQWITFKQGSKPQEMVEYLQGKAKYLCIGESGHANRYLSSGDIHVYVSNDKNGNPKTARIAIAATQDGKIYEIRGDYNANEDIDPIISQTKVLEKQAHEFENGKEYVKKNDDMRQLTQIDRKCLKRDKKTGEVIGNLQPELTKEELMFLYEIDAPIEGFGYQKDPRIEEIRSKRNIKEDLSFILNIPQDNISFTKEEVLKGGIKYHYGDLYLYNLTSAEGLKLPESIGGGLYLGSLTSAKGLKLPESIGGDLDLGSLTSAEGLKLPESIGGGLNLHSLTSAEGLKLPESIGGGLNLHSLTSAEGLKLPESIGGYLDLRSLTSAEGLKLPESIGGGLNLYSLTSAEKDKLRKLYPKFADKI